MKKVRIGNDIRLAVDLRQYLNPRKYLREREVYNPTDADFENLDGGSDPFVNKETELYYPNVGSSTTQSSVSAYSKGTPIGIRSVKAILINNTLKEKRAEEFKKKNRFITRFPIEPCIEAFHSTPYNVCNSGYPTWHTYPLWYGKQEHFLYSPHHHYYKGFGPNPHFDGLYRPLPMNDGSEYYADVMATEMQNVVEVSFPAEDQRFTGKYTLIIVAKVYAPGFNHQNLKTITIDFPDVIELVKTSDEVEDNDIAGTHSQVIDKLPAFEVIVDPDTDVYVNNASLQTDNGSRIVLERTDGENINIDMSSVLDWGDPDK